MSAMHILGVGVGKEAAFYGNLVTSSLQNDTNHATSNASGSIAALRGSFFSRQSQEKVVLNSRDTFPKCDHPIRAETLQLVPGNSLLRILRLSIAFKVHKCCYNATFGST